MNGRVESRCVICREEHIDSDGWFLLTENRWTDRVMIFGWNDVLASQPGVHAACCAGHVQQLVVHWMATGSLEYPFAESRPEHKRSLLPRAARPAAVHAEPNVSGSRVLSELAVHRESLERALVESPESLAAILRALLSALGDSSVSTIDQPGTEVRREEELYALT